MESMRVAVFSPLPPAPTGVADYSRLLLENLIEREPSWKIDVHTEGETSWQGAAAVGELPDNLLEVLPVYQMGNSHHHDFIYSYLFRYPGVVVLHDLVLHHARLASYMKSPEVEAYRLDMGNQEKRRRAMSRLEEYAAEIETTYPGRGSAITEIALRMGGGRVLYEFPLHELVVRVSRMTLVHSPSAKKQVLERCPNSEVRTVRMGIELPAVVSREEARRKLGLGPGFILSSLGLVTPEKRISMALRALKRLVLEGIDALYLLVGGTVSHYDPLEEANELGIASRVRLTGRVSEEDFWLYAFSSDLCLNLRYPSAGETSASLLRLMAAGRAVVITDQMHYLDLPVDVVARTSLEGNEDGLYCDLMELLRHPQKRRSLEENSRRFVSSQHGIDAMLDDYVRCLTEARNLDNPPADLPHHLRTANS
jgi:glycosyltransferase involved in cell wall biosynthesis